MIDVRRRDFHVGNAFWHDGSHFSDSSVLDGLLCRKRVLVESKSERKRKAVMGNKETCTECRIYEALVPLKDGRNMCEFCTEDWLQEEWEKYKPGDGGVELDI